MKTFILFILLAACACHRTAIDEEPPQWLFDTYSDRAVGVTESGSVTRYRFYPDNRVEVERDSYCGSVAEAWELVWAANGPNSLILRVPPGAPANPDSSFASEWYVNYSGECDSLELGFVRVSTGERESLGPLRRGAVCSAPTEPPEDWGGGEWDQCEWFWCDAAPDDGCD